MEDDLGVSAEFAGRPWQLKAKIDEGFCPILEFFAQAHKGNDGWRYFVFARWGDAGYLGMAHCRLHQDFFRDCRVPAKETDVWLAALKRISITFVCEHSCFDGESGVIRISHPRNVLEIAFQDMVQPEWEPILDFIALLEEQIPLREPWP